MRWSVSITDKDNVKHVLGDRFDSSEDAIAALDEEISKMDCPLHAVVQDNKNNLLRVSKRISYSFDYSRKPPIIGIREYFVPGKKVIFAWIILVLLTIFLILGMKHGCADTQPDMSGCFQERENC